MFRIRLLPVLLVALLMAGCATSGTTSTSVRTGPSSKQALRGLSPHDAVVATERAFAKTMADRDFAAFRTFLSNEAIFISGPTPLRGKQHVADVWKSYFESPDAPFSWEPERVVVLESEGLAFSSGPVHGPDGTQVGAFNSVWRLETGGVWRIIFDKGGCACN